MSDGKLIQPESQSLLNNAPGETLDKLRNKTKQPIQITWKNITITATPPKPKCKKNAPAPPSKEIIKGVSGTVMPGQFLAIVGASGMSRPPKSSTTFSLD